MDSEPVQPLSSSSIIGPLPLGEKKGDMWMKDLPSIYSLDYILQGTTNEPSEKDPSKPGHKDKDTGDNWKTLVGDEDDDKSVEGLRFAMVQMNAWQIEDLDKQLKSASADLAKWRSITQGWIRRLYMLGNNPMAGATFIQPVED